MSYIDELIQNLRNGCVQSQKRWSGDCGEMSRVDECETDALMNQAAAELSMTKERMWAITHYANGIKLELDKVRKENSRLRYQLKKCHSTK